MPGNPSFRLDTLAAGTRGFDSVIANASVTIATANPAIGPAIPMSNSAARERIGALIRITAPNVPISVGAGIKNGSVARTP